MRRKDRSSRSGPHSRNEADAVYTITGAQASLDDDLGPRMRRYLISMSIRTICFVLAVVFTGTLRWIFIAAAVFLPYIAVVMANAAPRKRPGAAEYRPDQPALPAADREGLPPGGAGQ
ncbi:MAG: DUF3099 domain-containing protein [Actinomycetota bacterium]